MLPPSRERSGRTTFRFRSRSGVTGINGMTAYFGLLDVGLAAPRRYRGGIDGGRRGRLGGRADREDLRLSNGRDSRRAGQGCPVPRAVRLRCRDRLQERRSRLRARRILPERRQRLFRQYRWRDQRHRSPPSRRRRSRGHLRNRFGLKLESLAQRAARRASSAGQARTHAGLRHLRLRASVRRGPRSPGAWIRDGRLRYSEDVLEGIEHAPGAIAGLYRGENTGKRLIRIR